MVLASTRFVVLALFASFGGAVAANPIRKVVNMLQAIQAKVEAEGAAEEKVFTKFMYYCKNGDAALAKRIADVKANASDPASDVGLTESVVKQLGAGFQAFATEVAAAKNAMALATNIRTNQASAFVDSKSQAATNIADATTAENAAIKAYDELMAAKGDEIVSLVLNYRKYVPYSAAKTHGSEASLSRWMRLDVHNLTAAAKSVLTPEQPPVVANVPAAAEQAHRAAVVDAAPAEAVMQEMPGTASAENTAPAAAPLPVKKAESGADEGAEHSTSFIEEKMVRLGNVQEEIAEMEVDRGDTNTALWEEKNLGESCALKTKEHEQGVKLRSEELVALAEAIKILNEDRRLI